MMIMQQWQRSINQVRTKIFFCTAPPLRGCVVLQKVEQLREIRIVLNRERYYIVLA